MPVNVLEDKVFLRHPQGSSAELLLYGASVTSWKSALRTSAEPTEHLFVSSKAILDGSKPVRGGIPVVFPCFGAPTHKDHSKLPQHGFARSEVWRFDRVVVDSLTHVSVRLTLVPTERINAVYEKPFHLTYEVTLSEHELSTDLHVKNTSIAETLEFQALFHNYINAPSGTTLVTGLKNNIYFDKTDPTEEGKLRERKEARDAVDVKTFTDFVYENAPQEYHITWPGGGLAIKSSELKDVVIWNPQQEKGSKISDMEDEGWERFICVEPGYVRGFVKLEPGGTWIGKQLLSVVDDEHHLNQL